MRTDHEGPPAVWGPCSHQSDESLLYGRRFGLRPGRARSGRSTAARRALYPSRQTGYQNGGPQPSTAPQSNASSGRSGRGITR